MADVYEKALKRRDPSGATGEDTDKHEKKPENGAKGDGKKDGKKKVEEGRGSSSTGKIVSLMSGDANRLSFASLSLPLSLSREIEGS